MSKNEEEPLPFDDERRRATPRDGRRSRCRGIRVLEQCRRNLVRERENRLDNWEGRFEKAAALLDNLAAARTTVEYQAFGVTIKAQGDEADPAFREALERIHDLSQEHLDLQKREMDEQERARAEHDQRQWLKTIADFEYANDGILTKLEVPPAIRAEIDAAEGPLDSKFLNWLWAKMAKDIGDDDQG